MKHRVLDTHCQDGAQEGDEHRIGSQAGRQCDGGRSRHREQRALTEH
jgi:hypothetical protein